MTKNDSTPTPTLWVGTNFGSVIVISLTMPDNYDNRVLCLQTVLATPTPCIFRLKGPILNIGFMDSTGALLSLKADQWKDSPADIPGGSATAKRTGSLTIARSGSGGAGSKPAKISPSSSSSSDFRDSHLVVITSEKQVRLIAMPLQLCAQKANITETSQAVRADIVQMKTQDAVCLAVYVATGNIIVYSLPSLRQLVDVDFLPLTDVRIARTLTFSTNGHGMYLSSPSELTKFTISANFAENLPDMVGALYTAPKELPEPPRQSFLKGFFGGAPTPLDREELFGESNSGKALKATARLIPGSSEHAKGFTERGERLGKLEDSTAKMQSEAEAFGSVAHAVMLKYRDKK
ncbi:PREDICTED: syntaxin-binding protein 5-like, partial [Rhagoletis zephyria]|uniref:syntaxin-binding protein 5-like n=1 Tax=Rhagoletis zephyria TaxID=28612 RepID=UPI0008112F2A